MPNWTEKLWVLNVNLTDLVQKLSHLFIALVHLFHYLHCGCRLVHVQERQWHWRYLQLCWILQTLNHASQIQLHHLLCRLGQIHILSLQLTLRLLQQPLKLNNLHCLLLINYRGLLNLLCLHLGDVILQRDLHILSILFNSINESRVLNRSDLTHNVLSNRGDVALSSWLLNLLHHLSWCHTKNVCVLLPWAENW